ncbi:MAG: hypothetical protein ACFE9L_20980 [Candidatus Hodarchaeota archaeon]
MEIEFNGISVSTLQEICDSQGISAEIFPLASRDAICPREEGRTFGDGETYYLVEESCWHGYFFCGNVNCGRTSTATRLGTGRARIRTRSSRKPSERTSGCDCSSTDCSGADCDSSSDSSGALIIFFLIIAVFLLLIFLSPIIGPMVALGIELGLTLLLGLFDLLTFGIFRKKFKRVLIYFRTPLSDSQLRQFVANVASMGGLPRHFLPRYDTNGFWILRTGAYLFIPSLIATILVLILQPTNGLLFRVPIGAFIFSIVLVWLGNLMIRRKANVVARGI